MSALQHIMVFFVSSSLLINVYTYSLTLLACAL